MKNETKEKKKGEFIVFIFVRIFNFKFEKTKTKMSATNSEVLRLTFRRIIPAGLALGAGMEGFMYFTGE